MISLVPTRIFFRLLRLVITTFFAQDASRSLAGVSDLHVSVLNHYRAVQVPGSAARVYSYIQYVLSRISQSSSGAEGKKSTSCI